MKERTFTVVLLQDQLAVPSRRFENVYFIQLRQNSYEDRKYNWCILSKQGLIYMETIVAQACFLLILENWNGGMKISGENEFVELTLFTILNKTKVIRADLLDFYFDFEDIYI